MKQSKIGIVLIGALVIAFAWFMYQPAFHQPLQLGVKAPLHSIVTSYDGREWSLAKLAGQKPLLVHFFATWCPSCIEEMPEISKIAKELSDKVQFVGLAVDSPAQEVKALVQRFSLHFPIAQSNSATSENFHAHSLPASFLIGTDGTLLWQVTGQTTAQEIRAALP